MREGSYVHFNNWLHFDFTKPARVFEHGRNRFWLVAL